MKRPFFFGLVVAMMLAGLSLGGNSPQLTSSPLAAAPTDYSVFYFDWFYDDLDNSMEYRVVINSPSETEPTAVKVEFNNVNYTLIRDYGYYPHPEYYSYILYVCGEIPAGSYPTYIYAECPIGTMVSNQGSLTIYDSDADFEETPHNYYSESRWGNTYTFQILYEGRDIDSLVAVMEIDGAVNYSMALNPDKDGFMYTHDFGIDDEDSHTAQCIIQKNTYYYLGITETINTQVSPRTTSVDYWWQPIQKELKADGTLDFALSVQYDNWQNVGPTDMQLEINDVNSSLSLTNFAGDAFNDQIMGEPVIVEYRNYAELGPYNVTLQNDTYYDIYLYVNNGTQWFDFAVVNELFIVYEDTIDFDLQLRNHTVFENAGNLYMNITVNVTSTTYTDSFIYLAMWLDHPQLGSNNFDIDETDPSDTDYTDGKIYSKVIDIGWDITLADLVGDIQYYFVIGYIYFDAMNSKNWYSNIYFEDFPDASVGAYGVEIGDWYIYDQYNYDRWNLTGTIESFEGERVLYQIVGKGRIGGCDYIDYIEYYWFSDVEDWGYSIIPLIYKHLYGINDFAALMGTNGWGAPFGSQRVLINPALPSSYPEWFVPISSGIGLVYNQMIAKTAPGWYTLTGNTISATRNFGCAQVSESIVVFSDGLLKYNLYNKNEPYHLEIATSALYVNSTGALPMDNGTAEWNIQHPYVPPDDTVDEPEDKGGENPVGEDDNNIPVYQPGLMLAVMGICSMFLILLSRKNIARASI